MSGNQIQPVGRNIDVDAVTDALPAQDWGEGQGGPPAPTGPNIERYLAALNRFKWLILFIVLVGGSAGYGATKFVEPEFEVQARIMMEMGTGTNRSGGGAVQGAELLRASGWQDLLRAYAIADPVVNELALFVTPERKADSSLFKTFRVASNLQAGDYALNVNGQRYTLSYSLIGDVEAGSTADSIGRRVGFMWQPGALALAGHKRIAFNVQTPREASTALIKRLKMGLNEGSSFISLTLTGNNSSQTASTLNAWVEQFVSVATALKKKNISSYAAILEGQRDYAASNLTSAESSLERFSVQTATEPTERQSEVAGVGRTTNPAFDAYFKDKVNAELLKKDRQSIEGLLERDRNGSVLTREALLSIPLVATDPAAEDLRTALKERSDREFALRRLLEGFTEANPAVKAEQEALSQLRSTTIPRHVHAYLAQLTTREQLLATSIELSGKDLRGIPSRSIEEQKLKRQVDVSAEMYRSLDLEAAKAKLAEAATVPDVSVLDSAVAPLKPTKNTANVIILGAVAAAFGLGLVLAILLDQLDKRFRYPEQATNDLGLFILGVVPKIDTGSKRKSADQASQVVESFRTIRMNVRYAADPARPLAITITSPGPNDGKSLISSNLALSFAESGQRTLLIDGDIRRGELAKTFGTPQRPGLVEYLDGTALIAEVLHPAAAHPNLTLMPAGARRKRAPELLATARLNQLIAQMSAEYDVVLVDSPPLGAGFDAYALATATGNLALVMRAGVTDRKMAKSKMSIIDTLPVRVMGAVLNGIQMSGVYQYYTYYQNYAATDEEPVARLTSGDIERDVSQAGKR